MQKETWKDDKLNRKSDSEFLTKYLCAKYENSKNDTINDSFVLNINAEWGFGKTYFLTNWADDLKNKEYTVIYFNAWENDFTKDPLVSFISEINEGLKSLPPLTKKTMNKVKSGGVKVVKALAPKVIGALSKQFIGINISKFFKDITDDDKDTVTEIVSDALSTSAEKMISDYENSKNVIKDFKKNLDSLIADMKNHSLKLPIFVFIDELDRCRPTYAIELLENIKHLFGVNGIYFVVATASEQLSHSIKAIYGNDFEGERYLKRFFDQSYAFIEPDNFTFAQYLFAKYKFPDECFFSPLEKELCKTKDPNIELFALSASFFKLSLRDQEQVCNLLHSISIMYMGNEKRNGKIKLAYMLVLLSLRQLNNDLYEKITKQVSSVINSISQHGFSETFSIKYNDIELYHYEKGDKTKILYSEIIKKTFEVFAMTLGLISKEYDATAETRRYVKHNNIDSENINDMFHSFINSPDQRAVHNKNSLPMYSIIKYDDMINRVGQLL